jgi:hypothetical protein
LLAYFGPDAHVAPAITVATISGTTAAVVVHRGFLIEFI